MTDMHSCSYYCDRPDCIKRQRDELRGKLFFREHKSANDLLARLQDACEAQVGVKLPDHAEPWGCDVGLIREAIEAIQDATAIPDGWKISGEENGDVRVCAPNADPGILTVSAKERPLANRLLYALATSLLAASPQPECLDCAYNPGCCDTHD